MTSTFKRIIIIGLIMIALASVAIAVVMSQSCSRTTDNPLNEAKTTAVNSLLDSTGIKKTIESEIRSRADSLAEETGIPRSYVDEVINNLDIQNWEVVSLPEGATETGSFSINAEGTPINVTTYDNPELLTVSAYGQDITVEVPASAQKYLPLIEYAQLL